MGGTGERRPASGLDPPACVRRPCWPGAFVINAGADRRFLGPESQVEIPPPL